MTTTIKVKFGVPGFHAWPEAPQVVDYLRVRHRHMFNFQVECEVSHGDREVEFHSLKVAVGKVLRGLYIHGETGMEFEWRSCEDIARATMIELTRESYNITAVEVWEDGECGARVEK